MAELVTIARPYAAAAFSYAKAKGLLTQWADMLAFLDAVYSDDRMRAALANPQLTKDAAERMLLAVCADKLDGPARNLLILLVRNGRLDALPQIRSLYEDMKADAENVVEARVDSAFPLSDEQLRSLLAKLEARTKRKVKAAVTVMPELIGGVKVQIGDEVWDASVRGQLEGMAAALTR